MRASLRASLAIVIALATPAAAQTPSPGGYELAAGSRFNIGCYGPCDCAVRSSRIEGTFHLRLVAVDPLFTHYAIEDFRGMVRTDSGLVELRGEGTYRHGGEVALVQEMRLTLHGATFPERTFASGMVPANGVSPAIMISVATNGFACMDTVLDVLAKPLAAAAPDPGPRSIALRAAPNPFRLRTTIDFQLAAPATVSVTVVDSQGRTVSVLLHRRLDAGPHPVTWDGRQGDGTTAPPGVYLLRVQEPGGIASLRLVRIE